MTTRTKVLIMILGAVAAYAFGRWSAPESIKEVIKTVEVEKTKTDEKTSDHTKTTTVVTEDPKGVKTTTTIVQNDVNTTSNTTSNTTKASDTEKETIRGSSKVSIELVGAVDITAPLGVDYGINVSKPLIGPITADLFVYKSGRLGAGIGLTF